MAEYLYRYRAWDYGCYYATLDKDSIDIAGAWGEWMFCDEKKYNEIREAIQPPHPNHYEVEKLIVTIVEAEGFDPALWIEEKHAAALKDRERKNPHTTTPKGSSSFSSSSSSSMSAVETGGFIDGIGSIVRVIGDAIADGASAIGDGIGDMCD